MAGGRPSDYTQETADKICALITEGKSLRSICKAEDMPSVVTVFAWMRKHPEFLKQYAIAREEQAEGIIEECFEIADDAANDWMEQHGEDGTIGWKLNGEHVQRSRLRIDTRKWAVGKLAPKKYGDRQTVEHQQLDEKGQPTKPADPMDAARQVAFILAKAVRDKHNGDD
jgi:hypothetical protein